MSLYAIGDLHLSLRSDKSMDVFGGGWSNYVEKIERGFSKLTDEDVIVLCGDTSWGMTLDESLLDFMMISKLPGRKIILKGNHDYWWNSVSKIKIFLRQNGIENIEILNNNCYYYEDVAICGTRGWLLGEESDTAHNRKIMAREVIRLNLSLQAAGNTPVKLCFFHYPPRYKNTVSDDIINTMHEHGVRKCWYGHIHGPSHKYAVTGPLDGIDYNMVSADYIDFEPRLVIQSGVTE